MYDGSSLDQYCSELQQDLERLVFHVEQANPLDVFTFKEIRERATSLARRLDDFRQKIAIESTNSDKADYVFAAQRLQFLVEPVKLLKGAIESRDLLGTGLAYLGVFSPLTTLITVSDKIEDLADKLGESS